MKRMFYAIAAVAIVSGALAFKANHFQAGTIFCEDPNGTYPLGSACPGTVTNYVEDSSEGLVTKPCGTTSTNLPYIQTGSGASLHCVPSTATAFDNQN